MLYVNYISILKKRLPWWSSGMPCFTAEAQVLSLVKELRSHMPHVMAKGKKNVKNETAQVLEKSLD